MNEKLNVDCNSGNVNFSAGDTPGSGHTESCRNMSGLRERTAKMLSDGVSPVRIIREIKNDKMCTGMQKKLILEELHLIGRDKK